MKKKEKKIICAVAWKKQKWLAEGLMALGLVGHWEFVTCNRD